MRMMGMRMMGMRMTGRGGYTMIEVVVVMLVMGILAAVAAPRYSSSTARFRAEAAARRVVADINFVRTRAMMKGSVAEGWISFFPDTEEYKMSATPNPDRPNSEYWVDLTKTAYPAEILSVLFTNSAGFSGNGIVQFDMYGTPLVGNAPQAPMSSSAIVVASGRVTRVVAIDPATGKASIQ